MVYSLVFCSSVGCMKRNCVAYIRTQRMDMRIPLKFMATMPPMTKFITQNSRILPMV